MNRMQKISWWMVVWIAAGMAAGGIAVAVLSFKVGFPKAWAGWGFMGISGFAGLAQLIFKKDPGPVQFDERDHLINLKAARAGFAMSYLVFGILCMGIWGYYHNHNIETISIHILPNLFMAGGLVMFLGHAITILVLYGKDNKAKDGGDA